MTLKASNYPTVRPSLDLNFAQTKRLDPRITYSRASSGTYFDNTGLLKSAATNEARFDHDPVTGESLGLLVEESRTNLQTNSTSAALFTPTELTITPNALSAPDGSLTACSLIGNTANSYKYAVNPVAFSVAGTTYTFSFYAKSIGGHTTVLVGGTSSAWGVGSVTFDLSAVTATATGGYTGSITAVGNGWYRCVTTRIANASGYGLNIYLGTYQGDGVSGIGVWGIQAETGSFPTSYIPTPATFTSRASDATYYDANGIIQTAATNVARDDAYFPDSNGVFKPAGLLLEAAGTNNCVRSEEMDSGAWVPTSVTVSPNAAISPAGTLTADTVIPTTSSGSHYITQFVLAAGQTYSVFVKPAGYNFVNVGDGSNTFEARFNLNNGTAAVLNGSVTAGITALPNGWFRIFGTVTSNTNNQFRIFVLSSASSAYVPYAGNGTSGVHVWGAQVEDGSYPTSYIPTTTSTVTRAADVSSSSTVTRSADVAQITGSNFSSWYNANQGTLLGSGTPSSTSIANQFLGCLTDNTDANYMGIARSLTNNVTDAGFGVVASSSIQALISVAAGSWAASQRLSLIGAYATNDFAFSFNGGAISADTSGSIPTVSQLRIGGATGPSPSPFNGAVARLTYYPVRLPDATLQTLTS